jgi:hypothetical protein
MEKDVLAPKKGRQLVLGRDLVASKLLDSLLCALWLLVDSSCSGTGWEDLHVTQSNHADRLPDSETDAGSHAAVQALETVIGIDVLGR